MEENKDKKPSKIETFNDLIKTFILPLGGLCVTFIIIFFSTDTLDCLRDIALIFAIISGTLVIVGSIVYTFLSIIRMNIDIRLSEVEKNVNNSQKQSRRFLEENIKAIEKELRKIWYYQKPYKNLCYKNLIVSFDGDDGDSPYKKRKIAWLIKKMSKSNIETKLKKTDSICTTLYDLQRLLLEMGEYSIRERIGNLLLKYSNNIEHLAAAHIDFLGWTYMLSGTNVKAKIGVKHIEKGIKLLDFYHTQSNDSEMLILLARAYRHLGTTKYVIRKEYSVEKSKYIKENLKKADEYMFKYCALKEKTIEKLNENILEDWENKGREYYKNIFEMKFNGKEAEKKSQYLKRMVTGVIFNKCLCYFFDTINYKKTKEKELNIDNLKKIKEILKDDMFSDPSVDNHRKIKVKSLIADIDFRLLYNKCDDVKSKLSEIDTCLEDIETILKDSIYFDEGMELYLIQKFEMLCYDLNKQN